MSVRRTGGGTGEMVSGCLGDGVAGGGGGGEGGRGDVEEVVEEEESVENIILHS
jgi:hypothetical protein